MHRLVLGCGSAAAVRGHGSQERYDCQYGGEDIYARPYPVEMDEPYGPLPIGLLGVCGVAVETEYLSGRH